MGGVVIKRLLNIKSLRLKIILYFSILITCALIIVGAISYIKLSEVIQGGVIGVTEQIIKKTMANIDFYLRDAENLSKVAAVDMKIQKAMVQQFNKDEFESDVIITQVEGALINYRNTRMDVARVIIINSSGYILDKELLNSSSDLTETPWFVKYTEGGKNVKFTGVHDALYRWSGGKVLTCMKRVFSMSDPSQEIGHILVDLDYSIVSRVFTDLKLSNEGSLFLYDDDGKIIFQDAAENTLLNLIDGISMVDDDAGSFTVDLKGSKYAVIYARSSYSSWTLFGVIPYRELMKSVIFQRNINVLVILGCLLISIFISFIIVSKAYNPLLKLTTAMKKVEGGNFDIQVCLKTGDEIEQLGMGFNQMIKRLQELIKRVLLEEKMKKEAEIYALQAQINPHFLYNTLNSIRFLAKKHGVSDIRDITNSLISLCRSSLESGREFVTLKQELDLVLHYINIQKLRYGDVFLYKQVVQSGLETILVPRFTIQPLVENALFHGIMSAGGGTIVVHVEEKTDCIHINVSDDGAGMDEGVYSEIIAIISSPYVNMFENRGFNSIGIKNISDRIKLYCGEEFGLTIKSSKGNGTCVSVRIPKNDSRPEEGEGNGIKENNNC